MTAFQSVILAAISKDGCNLEGKRTPESALNDSLFSSPHSQHSESHTQGRRPASVLSHHGRPPPPPPPPPLCTGIPGLEGVPLLKSTHAPPPPNRVPLSQPHPCHFSRLEAILLTLSLGHWNPLPESIRGCTCAMHLRGCSGSGLHRSSPHLDRSPRLQHSVL